MTKEKNAINGINVIMVTEEEVESALEAARDAYHAALTSGLSLYTAHMIFEDELKDRLGWQYDEGDTDDDDCSCCIPAPDLPIL